MGWGQIEKETERKRNRIKKQLISRVALASPTFPVLVQVQQFPHNNQLFLRGFGRVSIPIAISIHSVSWPPQSAHGWGIREMTRRLHQHLQFHSRSQLLNKNLSGITLALLRSTVYPQTKQMPERQKDQQQALTRWWKMHNFPLTQKSGKVSAARPACAHIPHLTAPGKTPAPFTPRVLPRVDEEGLRHERKGHKKKRMPLK